MRVASELVVSGPAPAFVPRGGSVSENRLCRENEIDESVCPLLMMAALLSEGESGSSGAWGAVEVSELIEGEAEAIRGLERTKSHHGSGSLFDPTMILFDPVIVVAVRAMEHGGTNLLTDRARG